MSNVQTPQHDGGEGTGAEAPAATEGVGQDPHRMIITADGWNDPIGRFDVVPKIVDRTLRGEDGLLHHYAFIFGENFVFRRAAALLVVQGMMLQELFPADARLHSARETHYVVARGPFLYLAGELSLPHDPPLRLKKPIFAALRGVPPALINQKLLSALLSALKSEMAIQEYAALEEARASSK